VTPGIDPDAIDPQRHRGHSRLSYCFLRLAMCPSGPPFRPRLAGRRAQVRGHSVETELVALDVLHHDAGLVVVIGRQ
jgi:hypothetical protein